MTGRSLSSLARQETVLRPRKRHTLLGLALLSVLTAALVWIFGTRGHFPGLAPHAFGISFELASVGLGLWLGVLMWLWARRQGKLDLFELPVWLSVNIYFQVVVNVWLLQRDSLSPVPWLIDSPISYTWAIVLYGVGLTALWAGYALVFRPFARREMPQAALQKVPRLDVVKAIWLGGTLINLFSLVRGTGAYLGAGVGNSWTNYFYFAEFFTKIAAAILIINHFRDPAATSRWWLIAVAIISVGAALANGSKIFMLDLLWLVILVYYATGKLPVRWVVTLVVAGFMLVPVVNTYRDTLQGINTGAGVNFTDRVQALGQATGASLGEGPNRSLESTRDTFKRRQGVMLHVNASAIYLHPQYMPFVGIEMVEYLAQQIIPRLIWPNKPTERSSLFLITSTYTGAPYETSFSTLGQFGDSYRAGGWAVVIIWALGIGALGAWLYFKGPFQRSFPDTVFYITVLSQILRYDEQIPIILLRLLQFGIPTFVIINWGLFASPRRQLAAQSYPKNSSPPPARRNSP